MDPEQVVKELQTEIDKIDFSGGLVPVSTPVKPKGDESPAEPTDVKPATPAEPPKEEPSKKELPAAEPTPTSEPEGEPPAEPADDKTPAIPDSHYRAALHMGYKPEEISELYDANPTLALKTLAKCHETVNAGSRQLGEFGQRAKQLREQPQVPMQPAPLSRKAEVLKKLKEHYTDDPVIDLLGELIPDAPPQFVVHQQPQQPPQQSVEEVIAVRQQINNFFSADEMGVYGEFYGKVPQTGTWDALTPGQRANRKEVCDRAQLFLDGATLAGMQLNPADALERAHLEVTAPMAEQFVRQRIVASVQKRAKGVTLKPSGTKTPAPKAGTYNKDQAIEEERTAIKEVFG
jgi:hypothetical protein